MPPYLTAAGRRLGATVKGFTTGQRTLAVIGLAVLVLGTVALVSWLTRPTYAPLFTGLQSSDASAVVAQLGKDNVPYQLADGGSTVLVPQEKVYDERLKAASAGLPAAPATGYSLLDKMGVTSSEFQQNVTYKRAIEGELGTTISHLDGVKAATVQLALPEKTVFTSQQADPTASVFVETAPGQTLSSDKVEAIVHLTSAAVPSLKAANVSVVDAQGNVLSAVGAGLSANGAKQAADYQQRTQAAVQAVLDRVLGPGNATVAVVPEVDQQSAQQKSETFTSAKDAPPLSQSTTTEKYTGTGASGASGVLGPDNIAVPSGGTGGNGTYDSTKDTRDNAVNKVTEDRTIPSGALKRQSVSVAVNSTAAGGVNIQNLNALVSAAAGIDTTRGDVLSMQVVPFSTTAADQAKSALAQQQADEAAKLQGQLLTTMIWAGAALLALIVTAVLLWLRRRRMDAREPMELGGDILLEEFPEPVALEQAATTALPAVEPIPALPDPGEEVLDAERRRAQVDRLGATDPQKTAEFLRGLMDERQSV